MKLIRNNPCVSPKYCCEFKKLILDLASMLRKMHDERGKCINGERANVLRDKLVKNN